MAEQTLFNHIPGYPCYYSLKSMEGMVYQYRMSETEVISFTVRQWGSHCQQNFSIRKGNPLVVDHSRRLWGNSMQIMNRIDFLKAIGLSLGEFEMIVQIANRLQLVNEYEKDTGRTKPRPARPA